MIRNNWTKEEIQEIYQMPLLELVYRAATVHRKYNNTAEVQVCTLLSIKTGGCSEDCCLLSAGSPVSYRCEGACTDANRGSTGLR